MEKADSWKRYVKITAGGRWNPSILCFQASLTGRTWDHPTWERKQLPRHSEPTWIFQLKDHGHASLRLRKTFRNVLVETPCPTFSIKDPLCCLDPAQDISTHLGPQLQHKNHRENGIVQQNRTMSKSPHPLLSTRHQNPLNCKPASTSHFL